MENYQIYEMLATLDKTRRRLTASELEQLYYLAVHPDPLVRSDVAALLVDHYEEKSEQVLLELSYDANPLVRTDAVDSLCIGRKKAVFRRLLHLAGNDPEYTVRGYAVHSAYDVFVNMFGDSDHSHKSIEHVLAPLLAKEKDRWVRTCYFCVLYLCGRKDCFPFLLDYLDDEDFYVRSSVLNTFEEILDEDNEKKIGEALRYCLPFEENETLSARMEELLLIIEDYNGDSLL